MTVFRERLIERGKQKVFEEMLEEIMEIAWQSGVQFGSIQIIDSVHSVANVNTAKDKKREEKGKGPHDHQPGSHLRKSLRWASFCPLVDHDLKQMLPVDTYAGDKGYDDGDNHYHLELRGLHSAIRLKAHFTTETISALPDFRFIDYCKSQQPRLSCILDSMI